MDMDMDIDMDNHGCESQWTTTAVLTVGFWSVRRCGTTTAATVATVATGTAATTATAELQQNYSSKSRATVTPRIIPPHKELQPQLQSSYSAATVRYSSYSVAPGL
eukprot:426227-Prymnesium_polylepis.1